jgi:hypothetical protein
MNISVLFQNTFFVSLATQRNAKNMKNYPDKDGNFNMFALKVQLADGIRDNKNLCLWRRQDLYLRRKYILENLEGPEMIFKKTIDVSFLLTNIYFYFLNFELSSPFLFFYFQNVLKSFLKLLYKVGVNFLWPIYFKCTLKCFDFLIANLNKIV